MGPDGGHQEGQLEEPEADADELHPPVAAGDDHQEEHDGGAGDDQLRGQADDAAHARDARKLGDQGTHAGDQQDADGEHRPSASESRLDQLGVPFAGGEPEADGQLHDHVEDRDQKDLEGKEPVAEAGPGLGSGHDAAGIGVGEHHHQAGADRHREPHPASAEAVGGQLRGSLLSVWS